MKNDVLIAISSVNDGTMKKVGYTDPEEVDDNRERFLSQNNIPVNQAVLVQLDYDTNDFCRYYKVGKSEAGDGVAYHSTIASDGLATNEKNLALFLPLADCVGAVIYDPLKKVLMLSHLGRHNLVQDGGRKSIEFLQHEYNIKPEDLEAWLSPAAGESNYPLFDFKNKSLQDVSKEQLISAGVKKEKIEISSIDTTKDHGYFSHSEFLKGNRLLDGRFAIAVMIK